MRMKNKVYSFSTDDAVNHGIDAAIILHNMRYWLDYARAHDEMENDGYYWMYATASKMTELFPFWSANKIQKLLKKLEIENVIIAGNYSKSKFDRTKWYTMDEFSIQPNGGIRESGIADCTFSEKADSLYDQYNNKNKDENNIDRCFENLWLAGMKKVNKPGAKKSFIAQFKKQKLSEEEFTEMLIADIKKRLGVQFGFDSLHMTTYLNQQRWNDELATSNNNTKPTNQGVNYVGNNFTKPEGWN